MLLFGEREREDTEKARLRSVGMILLVDFKFEYIAQSNEKQEEKEKKSSFSTIEIKLTQLKSDCPDETRQDDKTSTRKKNRERKREREATLNHHQIEKKQRKGHRFYTTGKVESRSAGKTRNFIIKGKLQ